MKIGIIGGGQLGMMMAEAGKLQGHTIYSLDPSSNCSILKFSSKHYCCDFDDKSCIEKLCKEVDILTYEFENIDYEVVSQLEKEYLIYPSSKLLYYSQNRFVEKSFAKQLGIKTVNFTKVSSVEELKSIYNGNKSVLKTLSGGYDGKGQAIISINISKAAIDLVNSSECILEEFIEYDYEASVIITRKLNGEIQFFPLVKNIHKNNILFQTIATNFIDKKLEKKARDYGRLLAESLNLCGTLSIEFFIKDNQLIFNEMAPRPHNSGHYTIEGCNVSQFANHIRAIVDDDLVKPILKYESMMFNILGEDINKDFSLYGGAFHNYNKSKVVKNRKMGHITFVAESVSELNNKIQKYLEDL
ncbi:MAG: 5-(carboxyamino)imidazole ribonucleotide synthase [Bacilli bacterium]